MDIKMKEFTKKFLCPYCGEELTEDENACCGEAGHGEWVDVLVDDDDEEDRAEYKADRKLEEYRERGE